ncbi:MAG: hypothetical protein ICV74_10485, partial [Thermoleophilia bacterium]|nr:hypothetical protein [Thermoleophilia bacterium]
MTDLRGTVRLDHSLLALDGEHDVHAMLELVAPEAPSDSARAPLALALVLDRSGSMGERNKMTFAREAAVFAVRELRPTDRVSVVAF